MTSRVLSQVTRLERESAAFRKEAEIWRYVAEVECDEPAERRYARAQARKADKSADALDKQAQGLTGSTP